MFGQIAGVTTEEGAGSFSCGPGGQFQGGPGVLALQDLGITWASYWYSEYIIFEMGLEIRDNLIQAPY